MEIILTVLSILCFILKIPKIILSLYVHDVISRILRNFYLIIGKEEEIREAKNKQR